MQLKNKTILIISNEPWGDIWYSKHNWAYELSKQNMVYFINPPKRWNLKNLFKINITIDEYSENLKIFNYKNWLPFTRFKLLFELNEIIIYRLLNHFFKAHNDIIFWTFDPYRLINPNKINILTSIYFIADRYRIQKENTLINNVNQIISVSEELTKNINNKPILNLSHGISDTEFNEENKIEGGYILYIGGVDYRLDYELIEKILKEFPNEKFLFIGKISKIQDKSFERIFINKKYQNLEYKMAIHFKELKNYIAVAKICIAPMKIVVHGNNINHHKLLQYLAFGKPVLSSKFNDYKKNELLIEYENNEDAVKKLNILLKETENKDIFNKRINFAKQFLYQNLIKKIEIFID